MYRFWFELRDNTGAVKERSYHEFPLHIREDWSTPRGKKLIY